MEGQTQQNLSVFLPTPSGALEPLPDFKIGIGSSAPEGVGRETLEGAIFALREAWGRGVPPFVFLNPYLKK